MAADFADSAEALYEDDGDSSTTAPDGGLGSE